MPTRSLNVIIDSDNRGFRRSVSEVDRDSDRLQKRFSMVADSASGLSVRIGAVGGSLGQMLPLIATATPALVGLGAAAASVGASFAAASAGAGALGAGLGASLAPVLVVGKQVTSRFEEIKKAYELLQTAQREGTAAAKKNAEQAMQGLSQAERSMVGSLGRLSALQDKVLGGASDRVFGGLSKAIGVLAPKLEGLAKPFTRLGGAIGDSIERVGKILASGPWQDAFKKFVDSGTKIIGPITTIFAHIGGIIRDVAVASLPMVQDALKGVADWFGELDRKATTSKIRDIVGKLVEHTKSWFNLFREIGGLIASVFGSGAEKGRGFVDTMTRVVHAIRGFVDGVKDGSGAGGRFRETVTDAFNKVKDVVGRTIASVRRWLTEHRGDINSVITAFKNVARFARDAWQDTLLPIIKRTVAAVRPIVEGLASFIRGVVRTISGLLSGNWAKAWSGAKEAVSGAWRAIKKAAALGAENLWEIVKDLGPKLVKQIVRGTTNTGKALADAIVAGIKYAAKNVPGMVGGALKSLGSTIVDSIIPGGDGLGKRIGDGIGSMIPQFGGGLMGARPNMAPVAGIASRFGLGVSSGLRPGAITSSGNQSYHSSGEALDISGSSSGMLGFFRFMKNTLGSQLAELIYTPGGTGVRNGSPWTYSGAVAADHFDHVHVAIDSGAPGVGDGLGRFGATAYGPPWGGIQGTGVTATGVNLKGNPHMYGVAVDPNVIPLGSKLRINPNPFNYGGLFTAFDTGGAIKGKRIDFYDWRGRAAQNGWGTRSVNVELVTGGSSAPGKGKSLIGTSGSASGGSVGRVDFSVVYPAAPEISAERQRALDFINRTGPYAAGRPAKGGGPTKGFTPAEAELRANRPEGPSEFDFLDAALAQAQSTETRADDVGPLQAIGDFYFRAYHAAVASGDPRRVAQARRDLTAAEQAIKENNEALKANTEALDGVRADLERTRADNAERALAVSQSQYGILSSAIWDAVNQFGGARVGLGTAGLRAAAGQVGRL